MSISWLTVLQNLPWPELISNAPKVTEGAKKLWKNVVKKPPVITVENSLALEARVISLEAAVTELHGQMLASSELIKALAEQNAQLVQRNELLHLRVLWLTVATVVVAISAGVGLFLMLSSPTL
jgi:predicted permease